MTNRAQLVLVDDDQRRRSKVCEHCGLAFAKDPRNTWKYFAKAKFCSSACAGKEKSRKACESRPVMAEAFAKWFSKSDGCWEWNGARDTNGYGSFAYGRKMHRAPKIALELDGRPVPLGMYACHHCDNPPCVRPDHLYPGTPTQNMADAKARGRLAVGSRRSRLSEGDVIAIRAAEGTHHSIAANFGVSRAAVSLIRERKTWRHLP